MCIEQIRQAVKPAAGKETRAFDRRNFIMKTTMVWVALCALMLAACDKKTTAQSDRSESSNSASGAPSAPSAKLYLPPEEMPSPFAPPGVFFLVTKVSMETDSGLFNYPPGTKVLKSGAKYTTFDGRQLSLRADQVTNDLRIATRVAGNSPKLQAAIQASIHNTLATPNFMPAPKPEPQLMARPEVARRTDGAAGSGRPVLDGDERKSDRSRKKSN